jgi:hypothetical protein
MSTLKKRIERLVVELCAHDQLPMVAVFFSDGCMIWKGKTYSGKNQLKAALLAAKTERPFIIIKKKLTGQGELNNSFHTIPSDSGRSTKRCFAREQAT